MRPHLKPALRRIWRSADTLQIGLDPEHAVVISGLDTGLARVVEGLVGVHTDDAVVTGALSKGADSAAVREVLRLLADGGALDDAEAAGTPMRGLPPAERQRLLPDLAARSVAPHSRDGGTGSLLRRRRAHVVVLGAGRVGASVASILAAAGIGRVTVVDPKPTHPSDLAPAGLGNADVGTPRAVGAARVVAAAAPSTVASSAPPNGVRPDLAVLAPDEEPDRTLAANLVRDGVAHLVVRVLESRAVLGPLVVPGSTSCLRCHDLHRSARDPAWPRVLAQVLSEPAGAPACDVVLATTVAGLAVLHVLSHLDGRPPPSSDATLELALPTGSVRRRSWSTHPACGCQWDHLADSASA